MSRSKSLDFSEGSAISLGSCPDNSLKLKSKTTSLSENTSLGEISYLNPLKDKFSCFSSRNDEIQVGIPPTIELLAKLRTEMDSAEAKRQGKVPESELASRLRYTKD